MITLFPENSVAELGITKKLMVGSLDEKLVQMIQFPTDELGVMEMAEDQYEAISDLIKSFGIDYKIVINIPDIPSPRAFLFEEDTDKIISYDTLNFAEKTEADRFLEELDSELIDEEPGSEDYE